MSKKIISMLLLMMMCNCRGMQKPIFVPFWTDKLVNAVNGGRGLDSIKYYVEQGADPNAGLYTALLDGKTEVVKLLVKLGANPNREIKSIRQIVDFDGNIELVMEMLRLLVDLGANPDRVLNTAISLGQCEAIINWLIKKGANPDKSLIFALMNNDSGVAQKLMEVPFEKKVSVRRGLYAFRPEVRNKVISRAYANNPNIALIFAILYKKPEIVESIIEKGINLDNTLMIAAWLGLPGVVKYLIDSGAKINKNSFWYFVYQIILDPSTITRFGLQEKERFFLYNLWNAVRKNDITVKDVIDKLEKNWKIKITEDVLKEDFSDFLKIMLQKINSLKTEGWSGGILKKIERAKLEADKALIVVQDEVERVKFAKKTQDKTLGTKLRIKGKEKPVKVQKTFLWGLTGK